MKALIFDNKVVDVKENEFPVAPTMTWVDCDNTVKIGFEYDGTNFISNEETPEQAAAAEASRKENIDLKKNAKAKLIAGEPLTEDEAHIIIKV